MATLATLKAIFTADATQFERAIAGVEKRISQVGSQLSSAGATMTKAFTLPLAGAATGLGLLTKQISNVGDELIKMQDRTGVSIETLSGLRRSAELSGASLDSLGTGLKILSRNIFDVSKGVGEDAKRGFDELGISVTDTSGRVKSAEQIMFEISDRFRGMTDETEKLALSQKLLGRSGSDLVIMLNQGSEALARQKQESEKMGVVFSELEGRISERFNDSLRDLGFAFEGLKKKIAFIFMPSLIQLSDTIAKFITESGLIKQMTSGLQAATETFLALPVPIKIATAALLGFLAVIGPVLVAMGFLIPAIGTALAGAFTFLLNPVGLAIAGVLAFGTAAILIWKNWDAVTHFFTTTVINAFKAVGNFFVAFGKSAASVLLVPFRVLLEGVEFALAGLAKVASFIPGVGKDIEAGLNQAKNAVTGLQGKIDDARTKSFAELSTASNRIKEGFVGMARGTIENAIAMKDYVVEGVKFTKNVNMGADAVEEMTKKLNAQDKALEKAPTLMSEMQKELKNLSVNLKSGSQLTNLWAASFSASFGATLGAMRSELERIGGFIQQKFVDLFGSDGAGGSIGRILGTFFGTFTQQVINRFVALWTDKLIKTLTGTVPALQQVFGTATTGLNQMATASTATSTAMQSLPTAITGTVDTFKNLATEKDKLIPNMNNLTNVTTGTSGAFGNLAAQTASATSNLNQFIPAINASTSGINSARSAEEALLATLERSRIIGLPTPLGTQFSSVQTTSLLDQLLAAAGVAGGGGIAGLLGGLGAGASVANFIGSLRPESLTNPITAAIGAIMSGLNFAGINIPIISNIQGFIGGVFGSITDFFRRFFGGSGASRDRAVSLLNAFRDWASPLATQAESFATGGNFAAAINNLFTGRQLSEHSEVNQFPGIGDRARELLGWGGTVGDYIRSNAGDILSSIISQTDAAVAQLRDAESQRIDFNLRRDAVSRLAGLSSGAFGRGLEMAALFPSPFFATLANFAHGGPVGFDNPELAVMHPNDRFVLTGSGPNSIQELARLISQGGGRPSVINNFNIEINEAGGPIDVDKLSRDLTWRMEQTLRAVVVK